MVKRYTSSDKLVPFICGHGPFSISIPIVKSDKYNL